MKIRLAIGLAVLAALSSPAFAAFGAERGGAEKGGLQGAYRGIALRHVRKGTVVKPNTAGHEMWINVKGLHGSVERIATGHAMTSGWTRQAKLPLVKTLASSKKVNATQNWASDGTTWKASTEWGRTTPYILDGVEPEHPFAGKLLTHTPTKSLVIHKTANIQTRSEERFFVVRNKSSSFEVTFTRIKQLRGNQWEEAHVFSFHRDDGGTRAADIIIKPDRNTPSIEAPGHTPLRTLGRTLLHSTGLGPRPILLRSEDISRLPDAVQQAIASMRD